MTILQSFCIAIAMYSRIPVPSPAWNEENMKYSIAFFPFVGLVIMVVMCVWHFIAQIFGVSSVATALVGSALPVIISGGIHLDGFMDTSDAFNSHREKEKKLEILKDPHIGAFSVISIITYFCFFLGGYTIAARDPEMLFVLSSGFVLSRILSALGVVSFKCAKNDGILYTFASNTALKKVRLILAAELLVYSAVFLFCDFGAAALALIFNGIFMFLYYKKCNKELGGITGDTCGYFSTVSECITVFAAAIMCLVRI